MMVSSVIPLKLKSANLFGPLGLALFMLIVQVIALSLAVPLKSNDMSAFENPESLLNPLIYIVLIVIYAAIVLLIIKYKLRWLLKAIINPAMIVTWLAGLYLAWSGHWFASPWLHVKLALVLAMSAVHGFFSRWLKDFAADRRPRSQKFYRIINEVPTILMIFIVIMVIVKPF